MQNIFYITRENTAWVTVIEHLVVGVICVSKQGIVMDAFDLMLNCGPSFHLLNMNFFP